MKNPESYYSVMFHKYPDVVKVDDLRTMLGGMCKTTAYKLLREEKIKAKKMGRTYIVPKINVIEYLCETEKNNW